MKLKLTTLLIVGLSPSMPLKANQRLGNYADNIPYIGVRSANCQYKDLKLDGKNIKVLFDRNCRTAFILPPKISYEFAEQPMFSPRIGSCRAYHANVKISEDIQDGIMDIDSRQANGGTDEAGRKPVTEKELEWLEFANKRLAILEDRISRREDMFIKEWGGNFNIYILDRDGDGILSRTDSETGSLSSVLAVGYTYFYPVRTGINFFIRNISFDRIKTIVTQYANAMRPPGDDKLRERIHTPHKKGTIDHSSLVNTIMEERLVDIEIIPPTRGLLPESYEEREIIDKVKAVTEQPIIDNIMGVVTSQVLMAIGEATYQENVPVRYGTRCEKWVLGICARYGPKYYYVDMDKINWSDVMAAIDQIPELVADSPRVINLSSSEYDIVGSEFLENRVNEGAK